MMSTRGQQRFDMVDVPRCQSIEAEQDSGGELAPEGERKP